MLMMNQVGGQYIKIVDLNSFPPRGSPLMSTVMLSGIRQSKIEREGNG